MRTIVITGASSGIGAHAAQLIAHTHPEDRLILVGRNRTRTTNLAAELDATAILADFSELDSVDALATEIRNSTDRIDVLANNAGGLFDGPTITTDGFELTFQVNHLAPMLLTHRLVDLLTASHARIIATSSVANRFSRLDLTDINGLKRFQRFRNYANSKLANILFTQELHARYHHHGISTVAFHPGVVATNFSQESHSVLRRFYRSPLISSLGISARKGGENLAYFIEGTPGIMWESGQYYSDNRKLGATHRNAKKPEIAHRHFEISSSLLNITWEDPQPQD